MTPAAPAPANRRRHALSSRSMYLRLLFLVPVIVLVFVFHVSGTALVIIKVVRWALIGLFVLIAGWIRRRRAHAP
jgi:hypothetical protein